jgi:hypothetical protein
MIANATVETTVQDFAERLMPAWTFPHDWLAWPPDTFALTSILLAKTGCYRFVIAGAWSRDAAWQSCAEAAGQQWLESVSRRLAAREDKRASDSVPDPFASDQLLGTLRTRLTSCAGCVTLEQLRVLDDRDEDARSMTEVLLKLHAVADEACTGFGLLDPIPPRSALAHCLANLLLTAQGSLSGLPKQCGVVLPKMRTPQQGLTVRSLSHHLTYHSSEVEVMWRVMPWPNIQENTINILAVPWPHHVERSYFRAQPDAFQPVRYFSYKPPLNGATPLPVERVLKLIEQMDSEDNDEHCRVQLVVFPESSMTTEEYYRLLDELMDARISGRIQLVPMVIAGVRRSEERSGAEFNEVRLAVYFSERWYEMSQWKHHRWKLDRNQIRQYGLESRLATARGWYEDIALAQRRLTFLAPNGWLTLCPLICEDLAQLEPVSELIRGVGPTLLLALLADGPQLKERWSARYASVFADDPGTAVLTLTSLGMAVQSKLVDHDQPAQPPKRTISLWKDHVKGWHLVELGEGAEAALLTISADWQEEYTADGRGDHQNASTFKLEGVRQIKLPQVEPPAEKATGRRHPNAFGSWGDIRELAAATFALNTLLGLRRNDDVELVIDWLLGDETPGWSERTEPRLSALVRHVTLAQKHPQHVGIAPSPSQQWPTESLKLAAKTIREMFLAQPDPGRNYLEWMAERAIEGLEEAETRAAAPGEEGLDARRISRGMPYAVLTCIYSRLERLRRRRTRPHADDREDPKTSTEDRSYPRLPTDRAATLFAEVERALKAYGY